MPRPSRSTRATSGNAPEPVSVGVSERSPHGERTGANVSEGA